MNDSTIKTADKNSMQQTLIAGLTGLIAGQKQFAEEFGLNLSRVFPDLEDLWQSNDFKPILANWLKIDEEGEGAIRLRQLFEVLAKHQLALMAALDGIAMQTLNEISIATETAKPAKTWLQNFQGKPSNNKANALDDLKNNHQLRYQRLIMPGFLDAYIRIRENLEPF